METIKKENTQEQTTGINEISFPDGFTLQCLPSLNKYLYIFRDDGGNETSKIKYSEPLMITDLSTVGKEIRNHLNPQGDYSKAKIQSDFQNIKVLLNEYVQLHLIKTENEKEHQNQLEEQELQLKIDEAKQILQYKNLPLLYIASLVSWGTAGEKVNIMLTFIAYCSQVILKNPINVIGLGEGGSGKTHIQEEALKMIPDEFILNEKKTTEAALFRRAEIDPYFYDGKIVNYGDLGGRNSQDFIMEVKDLLKELQSDGYLNKPLVVPSADGGFEVRELELFGNPCSTYTTVPGFVFDGQEMSRSIFITPRMDNKKVFNARKKVIELPGRTHTKLKLYNKELEKVKYMVYLLRERMDEISIINPYSETVINFLGESEYFKRDFDKYNSILKTITSFNSYHREPYEIDGVKYLFTTLDDIQLFISLLSKYHESISVNISPKAAEILNDLRGMVDVLIEEGKIPDDGSITVNQYFEFSNINLSKKSFWRYFGELNSAGFLRVVGNDNKANVYQLSGRVSGNMMDGLLNLSEAQQQLIKYEIGSNALDYVLMDEAHEGLDINWFDENVDKPWWDYFDG